MNSSADFESRLLEGLSCILEVVQTIENTRRYGGGLKREQIFGNLYELDKRLRDIAKRWNDSVWPNGTEPLHRPVGEAIEVAATKLSTLSELDLESVDRRSIERVLSIRPKLCALIYPLAQHFSLVHRFFLDGRKQDVPMFVSGAQTGDVDFTGISHIENRTDQKGGFSLYIPESYDESTSYPLVFALHGGSGHGSSFLWSWLRTARTEKLILVAPTSVGPTWALMGPDVDSPNLLKILNTIKQTVRVDEQHMLLTGMSDGGTFIYVSGFQDESPFTHLAPCSASFHPFIVEMMSKERLNDLPIHITHGVHDQMFDVEVARMAEYALSAAGAAVSYRELPDLGHRYPEEGNPELVDWFLSAND